MDPGARRPACPRSIRRYARTLAADPDDHPGARRGAQRQIGAGRATGRRPCPRPSPTWPPRWRPPATRPRVRGPGRGPPATPAGRLARPSRPGPDLAGVLARATARVLVDALGTWVAGDPEFAVDAAGLCAVSARGAAPPWWSPTRWASGCIPPPRSAAGSATPSGGQPGGGGRRRRGAAGGGRPGPRAWTVPVAARAGQADVRAACRLPHPVRRRPPARTPPPWTGSRWSAPASGWRSGASGGWPAGSGRRPVAAAVVVAADLASPGMLHFDGLVDSADGLLPPMDRARRLEVMADPHAAPSVWPRPWPSCWSAGPRWPRLRPGVLLLGGLWCLSRTAMAVVARTQPYARGEAAWPAAFACGLPGPAGAARSLAGMRPWLSLGCRRGADRRVAGVLAARPGAAAGGAPPWSRRRRRGAGPPAHRRVHRGRARGVRRPGRDGRPARGGGPVVRSPVVRWTAARRPALAAVALGIAADWLLGEPPAGVASRGGVRPGDATAGRAVVRRHAPCGACRYAASGTALAAGAGWRLTAGICPASGPAPGPEPVRPPGGRFDHLRAAVAVGRRHLCGRGGGPSARPPATWPGPARRATSTGPGAGYRALVGRDPAGLDAARDRPGRRRVGGREHRRRRRRARPVGGPGGPAGRPRLPGGQHAGRHGRPPLPALRPLRLGRPPGVDDVAGWVPARLTAAAGGRGAARARPAAVWPRSGDQAPAHPSPNAGVAEAAFAAALGVRLGGVNRYGGRARASGHRSGAGAPPRRADIAGPSGSAGDVTRWPSSAGRPAVAAMRSWRSDRGPVPGGG